MLRQAEFDREESYAESEVVRILQTEEYTLNAVNNYGENLLHISVANGCSEIVKQILKKEEISRIIDRKNQFGWTPLMLAIRNRDIAMTKLLLETRANTNESTYLGMSVLGLAAAIGTEMFDLVYSHCPFVLENTENDDINPLCVAAMRNDKDLFFRLLDLGLDPSRSSEYTQLMMKGSSVPEINGLAADLSEICRYWNDTSDNIPVDDRFGKDRKSYGNRNKENRPVNTARTPNFNGTKNRPIFKFDKCETEIAMADFTNQPSPCKRNLTVESIKSTQHSLISPTLACNIDELFPASPNVWFMQKPSDNEASPLNRSQSASSELPVTPEAQTDLNATLGYTPDFSPTRSASDINDENVFGENTPTPPRYRTPPRGMILNTEEAKMLALLRRFNLSHYLPVFLEQEVDVDLFMTLTDQDLIEIGVKNLSDREAILTAIQYCKKLDF